MSRHTGLSPYYRCSMILTRRIVSSARIAPQKVSWSRTRTRVLIAVWWLNTLRGVLCGNRHDVFNRKRKVETEDGYESVRRDVRLEENDPEAISLRWWLTIIHFSSSCVKCVYVTHACSISLHRAKTNVLDYNVQSKIFTKIYHRSNDITVSIHVEEKERISLQVRYFLRPL